MGTEEAVPATKEADTITDLESKIIRQVEYYFGDHNLRRDKFLKFQVKQNDGWVTLETMIKFNRLKMLSEDFDVIASALRKSPNKLLEVSEDGSQIRRNPEKPLPTFSEETRGEVDARTIYAKGFKADITLDELIEYFKQFGNAVNIQMRRLRTGNKKFKGSVFVTFNTKEEAEKFLQLKDVKYKETVLLREAKLDYLERKNTEFEERVKEREKKKAKNQKKDDDDKATENEAASENGKKLDDDKESKDKTDEQNSQTSDSITRGCLMKLSGLSEKTMREDIKEVLDPHGTVSYVDYSKGEPQAVVRFETSVAAEVLEKVAKEEDGAKKIEICDTNVLAVLIEGDEEVEYWKKLEEKKSFRHKQYRKGGWQNRGGGRKGFGRGRSNQRNKRKHGEDEGADNTKETAPEPPTKVQKTEVSEE